MKVDSDKLKEVTVELLQASALELVHRMLEVKE